MFFYGAVGKVVEISTRMCYRVSGNNLREENGMKLECDVLRNIGAIARCIQTMNDGKLKRLNLERGQFVFLTRVCENEGINPIDLSNLLKVDKATTTKAIQKLEEKGIIEKRRDGTDRRMWRLYPRRAAIDTYAFLIVEENENIAACFAGFTEAEKRAACELIERMEKNMERKWEDFKNGPVPGSKAEGGEI